MSACDAIETCRDAIAETNEALAMASGPITLIALAGAACMGFVLGWTLYFANRRKSGAISSAELGALAAVVGGGAALTWVDRTNLIGPGIFGAYGIGLLVGFLAYYGVYRSALRTGRNAPELESARSGVATRLKAEGVVREYGFRAEAAPFDAIEALKKVKSEAQDLLFDIGMMIADPATSASDRVALEECQRKLRVLIKSLNDQIIDWSFDNDTVTAFIEKLTDQTTALNDEAKRMKRLTGQVGKVSATLSAAVGLIGKLKTLL